MLKLLCMLLLLAPLGMSGAVTIHFPRLATPLAQVVFVVLGALAIALVWYCYRREADFVDRKRKRLLAGLRTATVLVILFICTGAFVELEIEQEAKGRLMFLVDSSASMDLADRRTQPDEIAHAKVLLPDLTNEEAAKVRRIDLVRGAFARPETDLVALAGDRFAIEAYTFGQGQNVSALELAPADGEGGRLKALGEPEEGATQLGSALSDAVRRAKGRTLDGVLVMTDGNWNRGEDPVEIARSLGVPVHAIGVGLPRSRDLEVAFIFCEDVVFKNDRVQLETRLRSYGYEGRTATLQIKRIDDKGVEELMKEEQVDLGPGGDLVRKVEIVPEREGVFTFVAELAPFPDEPNTHNNRRAKANVRVLDRKIRVLMVEDSPRWEYRFVEHVLEADRQRMQVSTILRQGDERGTRVMRHFPGTINELRKYDCIYLGDILVEFFTPEELRVLEEWVRVEGGGLVISAGRRSMPGAYRGTPLETLLPVECEEMPAPTIQDEIRSTIDAGFRPVRTAEGARVAALRFASDDVENDRLWETSSEMYWHLPVRRIKSGAAAWLVHPTLKLRDDQPMPIVASQRYGKGQVVFFATDEIWRWRFHPGSGAHRRFWGQLIGGMAMSHLLGGSSRTQLETDRGEYGVGDRAQLVARVLDRDYNPLMAETVVVEVEQGGLKGEQVVLAARRDQPGVFSGEWIPPQEGRFELRIEGIGDDPGDVRTVDVTGSRLEIDDGGMREDLLRQVAQASGGSFVPLHEVGALVDRLKEEDRAASVRREEKTLWNAPGVMLLLALFLGLEWFFRKRSDLL